MEEVSSRLGGEPGSLKRRTCCSKSLNSASFLAFSSSISLLASPRASLMRWLRSEERQRQRARGGGCGQRVQSRSHSRAFCTIALASFSASSSALIPCAVEQSGQWRAGSANGVGQCSARDKRTALSSLRVDGRQHQQSCYGAAQG